MKCSFEGCTNEAVWIVHDILSDIPLCSKHIEENYQTQVRVDNYIKAVFG